MNCLAEDCIYWTGHGCACAVFDLTPASVTEVLEEAQAGENIPLVLRHLLRDPE